MHEPASHGRPSLCYRCKKPVCKVVRESHKLPVGATVDMSVRHQVTTDGSCCVPSFNTCGLHHAVRALHHISVIVSTKGQATRDDRQNQRSLRLRRLLR